MSASAYQLSIIRKRKRILFTSILLVCVAIAIVIFSIHSKAEVCKESYKYYMSYEVQPGDTLWSIADTYTTIEHSDKDEYIAEIKKMNHMLDDDIQAGDFLVIAYYSYE